MNFFTNKMKTSCLLLLLINPAIALCMNVAKKPQTIKAKLLIDDEHRIKRNYLNKAQVEYIPTKSRKYYPFGNAFTALALETPFVKVIIETTDKQIHTIFPATKLLNCTNSSVVQLNDRNYTFNLTCDENDLLIIKEKYFPEDKKTIGFEKQFLASMNHFYDKCVYFGTKRHQKELRENGILTMTGQIYQPGRAPKTFYSHGQQSCGSEKALLELASNQPKRMLRNKSTFSYVMGRQIGANKK